MKKIFLLSFMLMAAFCSMKAQEERPMVQTAPGEEKLYNAEFMAFHDLFDPGTLLDNLCYKINFDGNKAYIFNLFSVEDPSIEYVVCDFNDNKISIPTGFVYRDFGYASAFVKRYYKDSEGNWTMDNDNNPVVWNVDADGNIKSADADVMLGLVTIYDGEEDDPWISALFSNFVLQPASISNLELPDNVTDIQSYRRYVNYEYDETWINNVVEVAKDGNDFYFKGLYADPEPMSFNCWIKGTLEGNIITVPNNQLVGADLSGYFVYNAKTDGEFSILEDPVQFTYDAENNKMTTQDWLLTTIQGTMPYLYFPEPELTLFELVEAIPAEPVFVMLSDDHYDWFGTVNLVCLIPYEDVNGNFIDPERITFSVFLDNDEPYVFEPSQYPRFTEPQSVFGFYDHNSYIVNTSSEGYQRHIIYLTTNDFQKVGVRSYYTVNGVRNESSIMWYDRNPDGIENNLIEKEILNVETYDLTGNKVSDTAKGLILKKTTYTDGTIKTVKEFRK